MRVQVLVHVRSSHRTPCLQDADHSGLFRQQSYCAAEELLVCIAISFWCAKISAGAVAASLPQAPVIAAAGPRRASSPVLSG